RARATSESGAAGARQTRRGLLGAGAGGGAAALFAACGPAGGPAGDAPAAGQSGDALAVGPSEVALRLWHWDIPLVEPFQRHSALFTQQYPRLKVEVEQTPKA